MNKVLRDFGIRDRPEGFETGESRAMTRLNEVGNVEMKRLNLAGRRGEVKFESTGGIQGKYYKEVKVYDNFYPLDVRPAARTSTGPGGYVGFIEYSYRLLQSARKSNRAQASAETASIGSDIRGRETYRYHLNSAGVWSGGNGELVRR